MSVDLYEVMEDQLAAALDTDGAAAGSGLFAVDTAEKADWALRHVVRRQAQRDELLAVAAAEIDRIRQWADAEADRCERDTEFLRGLLEGFHRRLLADDPKRKTVRLPGGELVARKTPDRVTVDPEFVQWAEDNARDDLVRVKVEPDLPKMKALLGRADADSAGRAPAVDPQTGEQVPGAWFVLGEDRFSVRPAQPLKAVES